MTLEPPPNDFSEKIALFLDIDGTLVEFANTPGEVASSSSLRVILSSLWISLGGALALISGRCIEDIDKIFYPLRLPVSGQHGLERRNADGSIQKVTMVSDLEEIRLSLEKFVRKYEGIFIEDKGFSLAVHFRMNPSLRNEVYEFVSKLITSVGELHILEGHFVFDIKPSGANKGLAIEQFLAEPPFLGRVPIFLGDDITDEDGFSAVNAANGISVRVSNSDFSLANSYISNVQGVNCWLRVLSENLFRRRM